jgi:hypothetical protein
MSGFQLSASLASSLAWPLVVVALLVFAWIKRDDIANVFSLRNPHQGRVLRRVRAGPLELEWDQLIESTAEKVAEAPPVSDADYAGRTSKELNEVALSSPPAAVLEAFARLELRLREIFDQVGGTGRLPGLDRSPGVPQIAAYLVGRGIISREIQTAIRNLSRLRNEASHRVGDADITTGQAFEYLELVDNVLGYLKDKPANGSRD